MRNIHSSRQYFTHVAIVNTISTLHQYTGDVYTTRLLNFCRMPVFFPPFLTVSLSLHTFSTALTDLCLSLYEQQTAILRLMFYSSKWSLKIVDYKYRSQIPYLAPKFEIFLRVWDKIFSFGKFYTNKLVYFLMKLLICFIDIQTSTVTWAITWFIVFLKQI